MIKALGSGSDRTLQTQNTALRWVMGWELSSPPTSQNSVLPLRSSARTSSDVGWPFQRLVVEISSGYGADVPSV